MILVLVILLLIVITWLVVSPFVINVNTRNLTIMVLWKGIGKAVLVFENEEWWVKIQVLLFTKRWSLEKLLLRSKKPVKPVSTTTKTHGKISLKKSHSLLKSFRVTHWEIALDTGNMVSNAWLYPINYLPFAWQHVRINFKDECYLFITVQNSLWRIVYAWLK